MKKEVFISIRGIQHIGEEEDVTELFTQGTFYHKNDSFYIAYDESETTGFAGSRTTLKIDPKGRITLFRNGAVRSHLIIVPGERNIGHYGMAEGDLMIGVNAKSVDSTLTEHGGDLHFSYSLDVNSSLLSENEVVINIKE